MFDSLFPKHWSTIRKLMWLKGASGGGGGRLVTLTGAIVSFIAKAVKPIKSLVVDIEPQQSGSGDPSPENVRPITGWTGCNVFRTGVNIFDGEMENGDISETTGQNNGTSSSRYRSRNYIPLPKYNETAVSLYFHCPGRTGTVRVFIYNEDKSFSYYKAVDVNSVWNYDVGRRARYIRFRFGSGKQSDDSQISINTPSTVHEYVPYAGTTYPISWETAAGTVYGGTLDVVNGTLTVDRVRLVLGNYTWEYRNSTYFRSQGISIIPAGRNNVKTTAICDTYLPSTPNGFVNVNHSFSVSNDTTPRLVVKDADYDNAADFKAAKSDVVFVCKLVNPITYTLTPQQITTLAGENNIWADAGDVTVTASGITPIE